MGQQQQLTLILRTQVQKTQASAVGVEQYDGGEAFEITGNRMVATFMSTTQTVTGVTDVQHMNTGMFDLTLFFVNAQAPHGGGGGGGGGNAQARAPEAIRLQGAVDFEGQQAPTTSQARDLELVIGSVSATTPAWASLIGKQFRLERQAQGKTHGQAHADLRLTIV
jgi:hypothetical protein